jgi:hypothetical protein
MAARIWKPPTKFKAWSYSRYRDWKRCPYFAQQKHLCKISEGKDNPAMARGSMIGKLAENYALGRINKLPPELGLFKKEFGAVREVRRRDPRSVFAEQMWCFDKNWNEVSWDDWDNVWLRVKMDLAVLHAPTEIILPVDHKTGKYRENDLGSYLEQLEIYGTGGLSKFTTARGASPRLWFLDEGIEYPQNLDDEIYYGRSELKSLQKKWETMVKPMLTATTFKPKPNNKCSWCAYGASKGGTCKFG